MTVPLLSRCASSLLRAKSKLWSATRAQSMLPSSESDLGFCSSRWRAAAMYESNSSCFISLRILVSVVSRNSCVICVTCAGGLTDDCTTKVRL